MATKVINERTRSYRMESGQIVQRVIKQEYEDMSGVFHTKMEVLVADRISGATHEYVGHEAGYPREQTEGIAEKHWKWAEKWLASNDNRLMPWHKEDKVNKVTGETLGKVTPT